MMVAFSATGMAYGLNTETRGEKKGPATAGDCSCIFIWTFSNDDGKVDNPALDPDDDGRGKEYDFGWGCTSSCDPYALPGRFSVCCDEPVCPSTPRYTKDVARTTSKLSADSRSITVKLENAYPGYYPTVFFAFACPKTVCGTILDIIIDEDPCTPEPEDIPDLTVCCSGIAVGQEIPSCGKIAGALHIRVEQSARQLSAYGVKLSITLREDKDPCDKDSGDKDAGDKDGGKKDSGDKGTPTPPAQKSTRSNAADSSDNGTEPGTLSELTPDRTALFAPAAITAGNETIPPLPPEDNPPASVKEEKTAAPFNWLPVMLIALLVVAISLAIYFWIRRRMLMRQ